MKEISHEKKLSKELSPLMALTGGAAVDWNSVKLWRVVLEVKEIRDELLSMKS